MGPLLTWLIEGAVGPALVGLPATWAATDLATAARGWFWRERRSDGLSRLIRAAGRDAELSGSEFHEIRRLLERESTWITVGRGTVEDLAVLIAARLPERSPDDSLSAGRAIAQGVLEFAVRDLEPEWFKQVLFARLERVETSQASLLDQAMLVLHADLAALAVAQNAADADRSAWVLGQLALVLDQLQMLGRDFPHPAGRSEVAVYLAALIQWLNTDPWPRDPRFSGPVLAPAAIEQELRITRVSGGREQAEQELDAGDLARRSARLVVLGNPGSGKTWLARRTARLCADAALNALAVGSGLDEIELPIYTTCARLFSAPSSDGIRRAVVTSALAQLPDLGGARILDAVRVLFEERNAPTLLVIDSLDEARGPDHRLRQVDSLPSPWRVILTGRPGSWGQQFAIGENDNARHVGVLQPLRYPGDVESFISLWFRQRPEQGAALIDQLARRPDLQRDAVVPLILTFYCLIGADEPLPSHRSDLYPKVIRRMLTGRWRDRRDDDVDVDACLGTLHGWAWSGATSDPASGIGTWNDEIRTATAPLSRACRDAVDHVAAPIGLADLDTGIVLRRFIHRSIREHLVASHVAGLSVDQAAGELISHIWYDPDWEYAAPAAIAMHPLRQQVLGELIRRAGGSDQITQDISVVDGCWEIRKFLAQVAQESGEADWLAETAAIIGQARVDLATSLHFGELGMAARGWDKSNGQVRKVLLERLAQETDSRQARRLAAAVTALDPAAEECAKVREALLRLLAEETHYYEASELADAVARLGPTAQQLEQARQALLGLLASETNYYHAGTLADAVTRLTPTDDHRARARAAMVALLAHMRDRHAARQLAVAVAGLDPTSDERDRVREALLELLATSLDSSAAKLLADAVAGFSATDREREQVLAVLLRLLAGEIDKRQRVWATALTEAVVARFPLTETDREQLQEAMLDQLARASGSVAAGWISEPVAALAVTAEARRRVREVLLELSARETGRHASRRLVLAVAGLDPTDEERSRALEVLMGQLSGEVPRTEVEILVYTVTRLDPALDKHERVRKAVLSLLAKEADNGWGTILTKAAAGLAMTAEEQEQIRDVLLERLAGETRWSAAKSIAETVASLNPTTQQRAQIREVLLTLAQENSDPWLDELAKALANLTTTPEEQEQVREVLVRLLSRETRLATARSMAHAAVCLKPTPQERAQIREALLGLLAREPDSRKATATAENIAGLDPTADEQTKIREVLLGLLARDANEWSSRALAEAVAQFSPSLDDLTEWRSWAAPPPRTLLARVRQNSEISAWLAALPRI